MSNLKQHLLLLTFLFVPLTCTGCYLFGPSADEHVVEPATELLWSAVEEDLLRGLADSVEDGQLAPADADSLRETAAELGQAIKDRDEDRVNTIDWALLSPLVERGIQDKLDDEEVGPMVAESLREQHRNFTKLLAELKD